MTPTARFEANHNITITPRLSGKHPNLKSVETKKRSVQLKTQIEASVVTIYKFCV